MADTDTAPAARAESRSSRKVRRKAQNRRRLGLGVAVIAIAGATAAAFAFTRSGSEGAAQGDAKLGAPGGAADGAAAAKKAEEAWDGKVKVLGDGSTSYTGPQPGQLKPERLKPGRSRRSSWCSPGTARWRATTTSSLTSARSPARTRLT